jgi:hypothetical protein
MAGATNTIIQILRSDTTAYPASLNPGELAYSNVSGKLFIGNTSSGVLSIGGKFYTDLLDAATASATGNTFARRDTAGNIAFNMATVAANASQATDVVSKQYLDSRIGTISSNSIFSGTAGQNGYSNVFVSSTVGGGQVIIVANNTTVATLTKTTASFVQDVAITGNLLVKGTTSYTNVQSLLVSNNDIVLNANASGYPLIDAYITVNRGAADNAAIIWNEATDKWQVDKATGTNYDIVDTGGGQTIAGTTTLNQASVTNGFRAGTIETPGAGYFSSLTANGTITTNRLTVTSNVQLSNVANVSLFTSLLDTSTYPSVPQRHYVVVSDAVSGNNQLQANALAYFDATNTTFGVGYTSYTPLPNTMYQGTGSSSSYVQNNLQNINNTGSADQVITADNGSDVLGYLDVGMAGGNYGYLTSAGEIGPFRPNDGWIKVVGSTGIGRGNLIIATGTANTAGSMTLGHIKFSLGDQAFANIFGYMSRQNDSPTGAATLALGKNSGANYAYALDVVGAANVASLYINNTQILGQSFALPVSFGGTGLQTVAANTILFGNGTGALGTSNAPTAGQVLQYRTDGVKFGGLDGGTF